MRTNRVYRDIRSVDACDSRAIVRRRFVNFLRCQIDVTERWQSTPDDECTYHARCVLFPFVVGVSTRTFNSSIFRHSRRSSSSLSLFLEVFEISRGHRGFRRTMKIQERSGTGMTTSARATRRARASVPTARISTRQGRAHSRFAPFRRSKKKERTGGRPGGERGAGGGGRRTIIGRSYVPRKRRRERRELSTVSAVDNRLAGGRGLSRA